MSDKQGPAGFLNRWSARKQQAVQEQSSDAMRAKGELAKASDDGLNELIKSEDDTTHTVQVANNADDSNKAHQSSALEQQALDSDHEQLLSDADMPPIESLSSDSDISAFFNKGVSAALKKAALRHVFMQPKYNLRDGLNDYDGDYTVFEPLGDTITSDMKWHTARKERNRLEAEARELEALEEEARQQQAEDAAAAEENQTDAEPGEVEDKDDEPQLDKRQDSQIEERVDEPEDTVDEDAEALLLTDASTTPDRMVAGKLRRIEKDHVPQDDSSGLSSTDRLHTIKEQETPE